jgi:predicted Na+-dependent transporter
MVPVSILSLCVFILARSAMIMSTPGGLVGSTCFHCLAVRLPSIVLGYALQDVMQYARSWLLEIIVFNLLFSIMI